MLGEIVTQIGAVAVALVAAWQQVHIARIQRKSRAKDALIREGGKNFSALSLLVDFELTSAVSYRVEQIFKNTSVDRFLLIIAVNGRESFSTVSAIFEKFKDVERGRRVDAIDTYSHIKIDAHYKDMLRNVESLGVVKIVTELMPEDSMLYNIYINEGVKAAHVYPVTRMRIDSKNDMLIFCSYASRGVEISIKDSAYINMMHGGIQAAFGAYEKKIDEYTKKLITMNEGMLFLIETLAPILDKFKAKNPVIYTGLVLVFYAAWLSANYALDNSLVQGIWADAANGVKYLLPLALGAVQSRTTSYLKKVEE